MKRQRGTHAFAAMMTSCSVAASPCIGAVTANPVGDATLGNAEVDPGRWCAMIFDVTVDQPWFTGSWTGVVELPETVDEAIDGNDEYGGVALLALVLNHPESGVALPRIKQALESPRAQTRANALQSSGHYARLHGSIDGELVRRSRCVLSDRTPLHRFQIRGYAFDVASDVGMFVEAAGASSMVAPTVCEAALLDARVVPFGSCIDDIFKAGVDISYTRVFVAGPARSAGTT